MTLPIQFSAEAADELDSAAVQYEEWGTGLGDEFMDAADVALALIGDWPHSGAPVAKLASDLDIRRVPIGRFDYHLAYMVDDDSIRILAVAHDRRRPNYWAPRIDR